MAIRESQLLVAIAGVLMPMLVPILTAVKPRKASHLRFFFFSSSSSIRATLSPRNKSLDGLSC